MRIIKLLMTSLAALVLMASVSLAQTDFFGAQDTVIAEIARIDAQNWSITISTVNDEHIEGLSIPLKLSAGTTRIVADSAVYTGGRAASFAFRGFRPDTTLQAVTLGMVANMGPTNNTLAPGRGRVVTVFVSSFEDKPVEKLVVDTTTTHPSNSLMMVAQFDELKKKVAPEEAQMADKRLEIYPAFVVIESK